MKRRTYLGLAGVMVSLSGCSGSGPSSTDTATKSPTSTASPTQTGTATRTNTATKTDTETETESPTESETETDTEKPGAAAEPYINTARSEVEAAIEVVLDYGPAMNAQFQTAVTTATTDFDAGELKDAIDSASEAITEAEQYDTTESQNTTLTRLSQLINWLDRYRRTTTRFITCYKHIRNALGRYLTEYDVESAKDNIDRLNAVLPRASNDYSALSQIATNITEDTTLIVSNLSYSQFQSTMTRLGDELNAAQTFQSELPEIMSGEATYGEAVGHYADENHISAREDFKRARDTLNGAESAIDESASPSAYSADLQRISCLITHLSDAADEAQLAAYHADRGNTDEREKYEERNQEAIDKLRNCDFDLTTRPNYY